MQQKWIGLICLMDEAYMLIGEEHGLPDFKAGPFAVKM